MARRGTNRQVRVYTNRLTSTLARTDKAEADALIRPSSSIELGIYVHEEANLRLSNESRCACGRSIEAASRSRRALYRRGVDSVVLETTDRNISSTKF